MMAARSPSQAVQEWITPLQLALSCVADALVLHDHDARPGFLHWLDLSESPVRLSGDARLTLLVQGEYATVENAEQRGRWSVQVAAYRFVFNTTDGRELLAFHLHPSESGAVTFPHAHVGAAAGRDNLLATAHIPTGVITLPQVLRLAIADLTVRPRRRDWRRTLDAAQRPLSLA